MSIKLPKLAYDKTALEPYMSSKTLEFHYGKHHAGYVEKLNSLVQETPLANETIEIVIKKTAKDNSKSAIFNNAAQAWNHAFYWQCMRPDGGGVPSGAIGDRINACFGNHGNFLEQFKSAALSQFGSGWAWLVLREGKLEVTKTTNAERKI